MSRLLQSTYLIACRSRSRCLLSTRDLAASGMPKGHSWSFPCWCCQNLVSDNTKNSVSGPSPGKNSLCWNQDSDRPNPDRQIGECALPGVTGNFCWGSPFDGKSTSNFKTNTLQGINTSHLGKRKIIFKMPFWGDMLVPWRVTRVITLILWPVIPRLPILTESWKMTTIRDRSNNFFTGNFSENLGNIFLIFDNVDQLLLLMGITWSRL